MSFEYKQIFGLTFSRSRAHLRTSRPRSVLFCCLLILCFSFICNAQEEEKQESLADALADECGKQPDTLADYFMPSEFANVEVIDVINGNTITVSLANKTRKTVLLTGLSVADITTNEGKASRQFLSNLVSGKRIYVLQYEKTVADKMEGVIALAETYKDVNLTMLKAGMASYVKSQFLSEYDNCAYKQIETLVKISPAK